MPWRLTSYNSAHRPDDALSTAQEIMRKHRVRRLPVYRSLFPGGSDTADGVSATSDLAAGSIAARPISLSEMIPPGGDLH